jgi:hypothetical protein
MGREVCWRAVKMRFVATRALIYNDYNDASGYCSINPLLVDGLDPSLIQFFLHSFRLLFPGQLKCGLS